MNTPGFDILQRGACLGQVDASSAVAFPPAARPDAPTAVAVVSATRTGICRLAARAEVAE
jgi:hypothetical protein